MTAVDVAVTGLGLVTPAGIGVQATWDGLLSGRSLAATDEQLAGLPVNFSCRVPDFDPTALLGRRLSWRIDRFIQMGLVATREAVTDAGWDPTAWDGARVAVVLGNGNGGNDQTQRDYDLLNSGRHRAISPLSITRTVANMLAGEISTDLKALGPSLVTSTACASGGTAIGIARDLLVSGACDIAITGGSESVRYPMAAASFCQMGALSARVHDPAGACRPFDADRDGFVLGEGAGVLVLERLVDARARNAVVRALVAGYGASSDGYHFTSPDPEGQGVVRAIRAALADAALSESDIDHVNAHGTSTQQNDLAEARALRSVFGTPPPVTANKSVLGHSIGGAGGIEAAVTVLSLQHQTIPPVANLDRLDPDIDLDVVTKTPRSQRLGAALSNSIGFGGQNAVLAFRAP
ncbi:3-oxoacyl-[acyl-carrier-protein] synthase 2 [Streptomyces albospinus]|uniref:3-oxoacyl-[acyl-carrier-protein] synthase 2 n=1 Tax=Streptomyces albospinus TaxID=285515 RepID=A0ABQ2VR66_9ACTN|nr:beta-ketoacyl-[acyl-carrier-protein] synthase family protein [Streptomyces albospinus]GGU99581.1 3-oxoacyl-[acyl-carrier-protein] synthase 2 [Streptomyces albospinus]